MALIAQLAREHPNKRYRAFMGALQSNCESKNPDFSAVFRTLINAQVLLFDLMPDWQEAVKVYIERAEIPS